MIVTGTSGNDLLDGSGVTDTVDLFQGGNDTVNGFGGDDTFNLGAALNSLDVLNGGDGFDILQIDGEYDVSFGALTIQLFEKIIFSNGHNYHFRFDDANVAADGALEVDGSALTLGSAIVLDGASETSGSLVFRGGASADYLWGGSGSDTISGGGGIDNLLGAAGADELNGDGENDVIDGGAGADTINGGDGHDSITGDGSDIISGGLGDDVVSLSGAFSGSLSGDDGVDLLKLMGSVVFPVLSFTSAGCGFEKLEAGDYLYGDASNNNLDFSGFVIVGSGLTVNGVAGNDRLTGTDLSDVIDGDVGADTLFGGLGNDHLLGGVGSDSSVGGDGDDSLFGQDGGFADFMNGGNGNDTVQADSVDTVKAGSGDDAVYIMTPEPTPVKLNVAGGAGIDTLFIQTGLVSNSLKVADLGFERLRAADSIIGTKKSNVFDFTGVEMVDADGNPSNSLHVRARQGADTVLGSASGDDLWGEEGNDLISAGDGDDSLDPGTGRDTVDGGAGNDVVTVHLETTSAAIIVNDLEMATSTGVTLGNGTMIRNVEHFAALYCGSGDDQISIHGSTGEIALGKGENILDFDGHGNLQLDGKLGTDKFIIDYSWSVEDITITTWIQSGINFRNHNFSAQSAEGDIYARDAESVEISFGSGDDSASIFYSDGFSKDDLLDGGAGNDTLSAGHGDDLIRGGAGRDLLEGGKGRNVFDYADVSESTGSSYDTINGFVATRDRLSLDFEVESVDAAINSGALSSATFDADLAAAVDAGHLLGHHAVIFQADGGNLSGRVFLVIDANGVDGYQSGEDLVIRLSAADSLETLSSSNFFVA